MARKAVQGYPEKSYYDNTRYLGIVATTDPLNEGLFKHMVNFDVSDTGQSVEPRDGFLTTTFKNNTNIITVSNKSIIFKDNNTNEYVIYDMFNNVGYLADVSAYNIIENYLPIEKAITGLDWTYLVAFLINQVTFIKNYYNAVVGTAVVKYEETRDYIRQYLQIIPDTKVDHIYDENGISKSLVRVSLEVPNQPIIKFILQMYYREDAITLNDLVIVQRILGMDVLQNENTLMFEVVDTFTHPTLVATDRNLAVSKSIIPEVFQTLYTSSNRPDGHISNLGTFVYIYDDAINYVNSFIYRNTNYNIKPYFSLNPAYFDLNNDINTNDKWAYRFELFNTSTEISDKTKNVIFSSPWMKYTNDTTKPVPIFNSSNIFNVVKNNLIATLAINTNVVTLTTGNTSNILPGQRLVKTAGTGVFGVGAVVGAVTSSNSFTVVNSARLPLNHATQGSITFLIEGSRNTEIFLGNAEKINNHYLGSRYIIFVVPKETVTTESSVVNGVETVFSGKVGSSFDDRKILYVSLLNRYNAWQSVLNSVYDLKTLREAINSLNNSANFYMYNLTQSSSLGLFKNFDESMDTLEKSEIDTHIVETTENSTYNLFLTGDQLLNEIEKAEVFKSIYNITFKFLPFASKDTVTTTNTIINFTSNIRFGSQAPYYVNGNPQGLTTTVINTLVQDNSTGQVYKQTTTPQGTTYILEGSPFSISVFTDFSVTSGSNIITRLSALDTSNLVSGRSITGNGIPANTVIVSTTITTSPDTTTIVMSNNATITGSNVTITFGDTISNFSFIKDSIYKDTRTNRFYRWDNNTGLVGSLTSITNPGESFVSYRWFFASVKYWGGLSDFLLNYPNYKMLTNNNVKHNFEFFKYNSETGKYSLETNLNILKNQSLPVINFTSSNFFVNQSPYYYNGGANPEEAYWVTQAGDEASWVGNPGTPLDPNVQDEWYLSNFLVAPVDTIVQYSDQEGSYFYKNTPNNLWILLGVDTNQQVSWINPVEGRVYFDTRTQKYYQWNNKTGNNGIFTVLNNFQGFPELNNDGFFDKGITGIFYMRPYEESELLKNNQQSKTFEEIETLKVAWGATALTQTFNVTYGFDALTVTYIEKTITKEPFEIANATNQIVFEDTQLLTWYNNILYISEVGRYYWFKATKRIEFAEEIVKVLQYKQIILVFTTQHLYAVYRVETTVTQLNPATNQIEQNVTGVAWLKQIVLYNLLVNKDYKDVIQIFNQMVLFYSEDGQLFMIRPSNTIDDQTRFSIQYFNKSANDILKNYHVYINERLASYGSPMRVKKEEIKIKALVSINFIKIIYYVPGVITYMLIYDVINNRYTAYDSLTFTNIFDKWFIESGDLLVTEQNNKIYFTVPYVEPNTRENHVDMTFTNNFKKEGINCLIDTGNMNLNNHLFKRFRDLHVTFKNLNASNVLFNVETMIDEIIAKPFYNQQLQVIDSNNVSYYVTVTKENNKDLIELVDVNQISELATDVVKYSLTNNLFENNNILMDFSEYTSSKLLTHRTSILGLGKVFRLKLQFISKGLYKLQNFGIIYKERRI